MFLTKFTKLLGFGNIQTSKVCKNTQNEMDQRQFFKPQKIVTKYKKCRVLTALLKGPINPEEHLLAFGTQKPENFNNKNRIYLAFWCVFKDIKHVLHEFFYLKKKFFFEFVCFPRFYDPNNVPHKSKNLVKNEVFHQNHQKSTKIDFFSNSFDRSLEYLLKYLGYDFWGHTTFFDKNMRFWTKTIFEKKKQKALSFQKKRYTLNNLGFCIKSALKKIIVTVFEKKKKESAFCFFFFKNFFCSKSHIFVKKSRMTSKIIPKVLQEVL